MKNNIFNLNETANQLIDKIYLATFNFKGYQSNESKLCYQSIAACFKNKKNQDPIYLLAHLFVAMTAYKDTIEENNTIKRNLYSKLFTNKNYYVSLLQFFTEKQEYFFPVFEKFISSNLELTNLSYKFKYKIKSIYKVFEFATLKKFFKDQFFLDEIDVFKEMTTQQKIEFTAELFHKKVFQVSNPPETQDEINAWETWINYLVNPSANNLLDFLFTIHPQFQLTFLQALSEENKKTLKEKFIFVCNNAVPILKKFIFPEEKIIFWLNLIKSNLIKFNEKIYIPTLHNISNAGVVWFDYWVSILGYKYDIARLLTSLEGHQLNEFMSTISFSNKTVYSHLSLQFRTTQDGYSKELLKELFVCYSKNLNQDENNRTMLNIYENLMTFYYFAWDQSLYPIERFELNLKNEINNLPRILKNYFFNFLYEGEQNFTIEHTKISPGFKEALISAFSKKKDENNTSSQNKKELIEQLRNVTDTDILNKDTGINESVLKKFNLLFKLTTVPVKITQNDLKEQFVSIITEIDLMLLSFMAAKEGSKDKLEFICQIANAFNGTYYHDLRVSLGSKYVEAREGNILIHRFFSLPENYKSSAISFRDEKYTII